MIRNGTSYNSFEEWLRKAYVDEAYSMGNISQQQITVFGVSAQTDLSRNSDRCR